MSCVVSCDNSCCGMSYCNYRRQGRSGNVNVMCVLQFQNRKDDASEFVECGRLVKTGDMAVVAMCCVCVSVCVVSFERVLLC